MSQKTSNRKNFILGLDIGGTKCAVVLGDKKMKVIDRAQFPTLASRGWKPILKQLFETIDEISRRNRLKPDSIYKAGISCGGPLDSRKGLILSPPNLPGWNKVPIVRLVKNKLKCPVGLENDANAGAVAEWKFGAGRGCENMIFLTFGTGLGAGLILNGRLYRGANDMAGEAGHIRLADKGPRGYNKEGSFEGFCSVGGLERIVGISAKDLCLAAKQGDQKAKRILQTSGKYLGLGISIFLDLLNPQRIIIGGIYTRNAKLFNAAALKVIRQEALIHTRSVCQILPSALGEKIGDVSALCVAVMDELKA